MEGERKNNNKRWYFTREQLENSPSRRFGLDPDKELSYRQQAANLLQDMGQRLNVSQLTINTAIVYMHRFYMIQSFTQFHRNSVAPAALFLAAKVEEQPKKLEHVIKVAHACLHPQESLPDTRSEAYLQQVQDLVILESIILQTLGFELTIDHPHTHVVKCTQLVRELTHEFLQILEKTPNRLKRIRNWRACQAAKKTKADDRGTDENTSEQTILNMISQSSSDTTIAGLMSMSTSSTTSTVPSLPTTEESSSNLSGVEMLQGERWLSSQPPFKLEPAQGHRTSENLALIGVDHSLQQDGSNAFISQKQNSSKSVPSAKVSLKEYRAKHAEELAAQKRQLENMEANVKSQYAYAAQNLLSHHDSHSSVILKMPIEGSENPERPFLEKPDKTALKMRIPVASGDKAASSKPEEIKMRIKVHAAPDKHNSIDDSVTKSREHKEKHKTHPSNHHHHHNHHSHKHSHSQLPAGTGNKRPGDPKHSSQTSTLAHKTYSLSSSFSSSSSSRKRGPPEETGGALFDHPAKIAKSTKSSSINFFPPLPTMAQLPGHSSDTSGLPFSQPSCKTRVPHMKLDKGPTGANGHNTTQTIDYQDTVNMLHSLLHAQGVQPTQPPALEFVHSYGEYLNPRAGGMPSRSGNTDKPRLPPLPSEPPPPLPPLPK
uniref:Cyclin T1 n=1 Tax=Equus caballus TaxID=9796 RepID=A0A9L0T4S1_HORSE